MRTFIISVFWLFSMAITASFGQVVINEVFYDPFGSDEGCFVELLGKSGTSLDGYVLLGVNGESGKQYNLIDLSGHSIPWNGYFVIAQDESVSNADLEDSKANYQNGPDNIELWHENDKVDSVGYGDFSEAVFTGEGNPTFDIVYYSIGRRPDGVDTNDNIMDFVGLPLASPGKPNTPGAAVEKAKNLISAWGIIRTGGLIPNR